MMLISKALGLVCANEKSVLPANHTFKPQVERAIPAFTSQLQSTTTRQHLWQAELTFIPFFGYPKYLFWISKIMILDIQNKYFGYQK